jgi:hypothetical protein
VKIEAGLTKRFKTGRAVNRRQPNESATVQIGSHTRALAGFKQFSQSPMPKGLDDRLGDLKR